MVGGVFVLAGKKTSIHKPTTDEQERSTAIQRRRCLVLPQTAYFIDLLLHFPVDGQARKYHEDPLKCSLHIRIYGGKFGGQGQQKQRSNYSKRLDASSRCPIIGVRIPAESLPFLQCDALRTYLVYLLG